MSLKVSDVSDIKVIDSNERNNSMLFYFRDTFDKSNEIRILLTDNMVKELLNQVGDSYAKRNERRF